MRDVAIIGGGIGGLAAGLFFACKGASVTVYEQAPAMTEVGAGLQLSPNSLRVLNAFGLAPALDNIGIAADAVVPTDGLSGQPITRFDISKKSPRYRFVHRADLIKLLAEACAQNGVTIRLGTKIDQIARGRRFAFCCAAPIEWAR